MSEIEPATTEVNSHYLERVVQASSVRQIEASEDIYSQSGIKLIAKGTRISQDMQERLIIHRLKKPLETCIAVRNGVETPHLAQIAEQLYAQSPELHLIVDLPVCLRNFKALLNNNTTNNLLSVHAGHDNSNLNHNVLVAMISASLASRLGWSDNNVQSVTMAALLHDIGELYIDPRYLEPDRQLTLDEWRHVSVHPVIGNKLVKDFCNIPADTAIAIFEHHERGNGWGYPCGSVQHEQSLAGQILATAELIASFSGNHDRPLERAELALRIVPGEFNLEIVSLLSRAIGGKDQTRMAETKAGNDAAVLGLFMMIGKIAEQLHAMEDNPDTQPPALAKLLGRASERFQIIQRSFSSTGLDLCREPTEREKLLENASAWQLLEVELITQELRWRFSELARDLFSRMNTLDEADTSLFHPLLETLYCCRRLVPDSSFRTIQAGD